MKYLIAGNVLCYEYWKSEDGHWNILFVIAVSGAEVLLILLIVPP
jgi:hypothetical protein